MAKILAEKQINSFVKGLVTEANPLTFPENSSIDESNFDLELNGSRSRRLGIDYETGYSLKATNIADVVMKDTRQSAHEWAYPNGNSTIILGVIRVSNRLYFINLLADVPSAAPMNGGSYITLSGIENKDIQTAVLNNYFIIVGEGLQQPIILDYDASADVVSQISLPINIRDMFGVADSFTPDYRASATGGGYNTASGYLGLAIYVPYFGAAITEKHRYNLKNQGWSDKVQCVGGGNCIDESFIRSGFYPANSDQWTLGKTGNTTSANFEQYDSNILLKNSINNSYVARGSYVISAFNRGAARLAEVNKTTKPSYSPTTISSLPIDRETGYFTTVASFAGRAFYSGITSKVLDGDLNSPNYSNFIFFSQIADTKEKLGRCYQENDPTSPQISDLLPSDGGTIQILEASKIVKLVALRGSILAFAENGVWEIFGDTGGFTATSFQISKISSVGVYSPSNVVECNGQVVYWTKTGIFATDADKTSGRLIAQSISLSTIQSLYNSIPDLAKINSRGFYDEVSNHVSWLYNDTTSYSENNYINSYNKELRLDLTLGAFYKYEISSLATSSPLVVDYIKIPTYSITPTDTAVYVGNNQVVTTIGDGVVITDYIYSTSRQGTYAYLTLRKSSDADIQFTLSKYSNRTFKDWVSADGVGVNYTSYLVTGYEGFGDIIHNKQVPAILFYNSRTEDGYEYDTNGNITLKHQSSCKVQSQWSWTDSANSGKWGQQFEAYRLLRRYTPSGVSDPFDYGEDVIVTKNKLRGSGKVLSLKIESSPGKDMKLLGWGMEVSAKSKI